MKKSLAKGNPVRVPYMRWIMAWAVCPLDNAKSIYNDTVMLYVTYTDKRPFHAKILIEKAVRESIERKYRLGELNLFEIH